MKKILPLVCFAVLMLTAACQKKYKVEWRGAGDRPETSYRAKLMRYENLEIGPRVLLNDTVKYFMMSSMSRIGILSCFRYEHSGTSEPDTIFEFKKGGDVWTLSLKFDKPTMPDDYVLFRDMIAHGGFETDTAQSAGYVLRLIDSTKFHSAVVEDISRLSWSEGESFTESGDEFYSYQFHPEEIDTAILVFDVRNALRYRWNIAVGAMEGVVGIEWLSFSKKYFEVDRTFDEVQQWLGETYGLGLVPTGKDLVRITVREVEL